MHKEQQLFLQHMIMQSNFFKQFLHNLLTYLSFFLSALVTNEPNCVDSFDTSCSNINTRTAVLPTVVRKLFDSRLTRNEVVSLLVLPLRVSQNLSILFSISRIVGVLINILIQMIRLQSQYRYHQMHCSEMILKVPYYQNLTLGI